MNICFLSLDYPSPSGGGGVGIQVRTLGRTLVQAEHRVTVVALSVPGLSPFSEDNGIRVYRFPRGNLHWYVYKMPGVGPLLTLALRELEDGWAAYRLVRELHAQQPFDLIEGTETGALGVALWLREVPLVIRLHGEHYTFHKYTPDLPLTPGIRLSRVLQRVAMRRARVLISPSQAHAGEIATELGSGHPPIKVIPNCIDLDRVPHSDGEARDEATVLFVGRLDRYKGIPLLLEAAGRVVREFPRTRFVLAGAPHPTLARSEIDALIQRYALNEHVRLLGHVPWEQLTTWYLRATVCVLPSYYETFGIAALEPMAFGVPVVVTRAGGLPEVVEDGVTGILVPPGDPQALAEAVVLLLRDPDMRERMGQAGRERVLEQFTAERIAPRTLKLYKSVRRSGFNQKCEASWWN